MLKLSAIAFLTFAAIPTPAMAQPICYMQTSAGITDLTALCVRGQSATITPTRQAQAPSDEARLRRWTQATYAQLSANAKRLWEQNPEIGLNAATQFCQAQARGVSMGEYSQTTLKNTYFQQPEQEEIVKAATRAAYLYLCPDR